MTSRDALPYPDDHHFSAAQGWFELGNNAEAKVELQKLNPSVLKHPDVLELRWQVSAKAKQWVDCLEIAEDYTKVAPKSPAGWIHRAYSLHELGRTQEAWDTLSAVCKRFSKEPTIPYNMACYACRMGNLELARERLDEAMHIHPDPSTLKQMALKDPDLIALWAKPGESI